MKKMMIIFAILLIPAFSLQAGIRIGAKAGVNIAKASFNTDVIKTDNFTGFQLGPIVEVTALGGFGVDAAILYSKHGLKSSTIELEEKVITLDVPVNLKKKFSLADLFGVYISAGPYVSFKMDDKISVNKVKTEWENKQFGVGLNFGGGVEIIKHLQLGVNYQFALNDDYSDFSVHDIWKSKNDYIARTRIWSITATYFF